MAHSPTTVSGPELDEAFLADRQRFWAGFTSFVFWSAALIVLILILMTVFLV